MKQWIVMAACIVGMLGAAGTARAEYGSTDKRSIEQAGAINTELAVEYLKQNNLEAAREKIDKALRQNPRKAETQMTAGLVYERLGDEKKALAYFNEAARLGKGSPDVLNNVAVYLCRKGDRKRGEQLFLQAAGSALYKTPEVAYANAGRCARADGRPKDAETYFRKALGYRGDMADALLPMAEMAHDAHNDLQARAFLQRFFAVAQPSASTLYLANRIETAMGDTAAAQEYAQKLTMQFPTSEETGRLLEEQHGRP